MRSLDRPSSAAALALLAVLSCAFASAGPAAGPMEGPSDPYAQVTIRRDTHGVPHILASSEEAAAFGHGYVTAEDHVLELGRLFLKARSEESAYFGPEFEEGDFLTKQFRMREVAETGYAQMPPWLRRIIDGYAAGYDRYVEKRRPELPEWVKPVSAVDVIAHARRIMLMEFSMDLRSLRELNRRRASAGLPREQEDHRGSNMWAIGKERSTSGNALLLGNPHLSWRGSQIFHEVHLTVPGKLNFSGTTLIGMPGLALGFNDNLGWSHTVNLHDSDDIYELTLDPADGRSYVYEGRSVAMQKREISIRVKTKDGTEERKREVFSSHYGPVVQFDGAKAYAFKSANMENFRFLEQWNLMTKARSLREFRQALDMQAIPMFNICYADREGNIFYIFNGRFPERPAGFNWSGVVPGNTSATEWNHILPELRLPFLLNPAGGYVQNCNSSPWYTTLRAIIDRRNYPADLTPNFNDLRSQLSLEMLEGDDSITLDEVLRYKFNTKLLLADRVKKSLLNIARGRSAGGVQLDPAVAVLDSWDDTVSRESRGSVLFVAFWTRYREKAQPVFEVDWSESQPAATPHGIGDPATALVALAAAQQELQQKYGRLDVIWGEIHRLRRGSIDVPIGGLTGDFGAFRAVIYEDLKDGRFRAIGGDSFVLAVEFTAPPTAWSIVAYSQTDDPASPHHTDQSVLFAQEKWKRAWFTEEDIAKNLERSYRP